MDSYWGGAMAAVGGALVFGAVPRILRRQRVKDSLLLAVGMAILANTRPFEGLLAIVPAGLWLVARMLGKWGPPVKTSVVRIMAPVAGLMIPVGLAMGYYNYRVTGDPLLVPYQLHEAQYAVSTAFLWQGVRPEPIYRHRALRDFWVGFALEERERHLTPEGFVVETVFKIVTLWYFFVGPLLTVPVLMGLSRMLKRPHTRILMAGVGALLASFVLLAGVGPHYAAPVTAVAILCAVEGLRRLRTWNRHGWITGRNAVRMILAVCAAICLIELAWSIEPYPSTGYQRDFKRNRQEVIERLEKTPGRDLVVVRYGPDHSSHDEWVYNRADIDAAGIVWAREMDPVRNCELLSYFRDRRKWLLEPDGYRPRLSSYPSRCESNSERR